VTTSRLEGAVADVRIRTKAPALPRPSSLGAVLARALVVVPAYPALFATTFLLQKVGESWSPLQVLFRPLLVFLIVVAGLQLLVGSVAGRHVAAYFVTLVFLVLIEPAVAVLALFAVLVPLAWRSVRARRLSAMAWPDVTAPLNLVGTGALAVTLVTGASNGLFFLDEPTAAPAAVGTAPADAPDIYLILLDGYPRSDLLRDQVGLDNGPFLAAMQQLGFEVADQSHSNYGRTALTLASMFNGRHVDELLPDPPFDVPGQARALGKLINSGTELDAARARGYEIVSIPSPVDYVTLFAADRVIGSPFATEFELTLTEQDVARRIAPDARHWLFLDQHRRRILEAFRTLGELPGEAASRPKLVFAHVLSPHPPIAFGASGEEVMLSGCEWTLCGMPSPLPAAFVADYAAQVQYIDGLVESTARAMLDRSSRSSVIIFFSDHGSRLTGSIESTFDNLILSYTPGKPGLVPRDATPINLLPRILNAYLGMNQPLAAEVRYRQPYGTFLPLQQVTP
jgi:hypothetical protein